MKIKTFCAHLLILTSYGSFAQEISSNDPGYSTHNYKHPNKAEAAKKSKKGFPISENVVLNRNYKQPNQKTEEKSLTIIRNQPKEEYLTWQNAKMPFTKKVFKNQSIAVDSAKKKDEVVD